VKESIAFISGHDFVDYWTEEGERTITRSAFAVAKGFDKERNEVSDWGDDE
jgi:hypothetical protein